MRLIRYPELKTQKGIPYSREHVRRLEVEGLFPKRGRLVDGSNYYGWIEAEIDAYLARRAAARDSKVAAAQCESAQGA
jgi:predicted DNA-binding transcriptional regulator AlpA